MQSTILGQGNSILREHYSKPWKCSNEQNQRMFFHEAYVLVGVMIHSLNVKITSSCKFSGEKKHRKVIGMGLFLDVVIKEFSEG